MEKKDYKKKMSPILAAITVLLTFFVSTAVAKEMISANAVSDTEQSRATTIWTQEHEYTTVPHSYAESVTDYTRWEPESGISTTCDYSDESLSQTSWTEEYTLSSSEYIEYLEELSVYELLEILKSSESEELREAVIEIENNMQNGIANDISSVTYLNDPSLLEDLSEKDRLVLEALKNKIREMYAGEEATTLASETEVVESDETQPNASMETICFGTYPQSEVTDKGLLTQLNSLTLDWISYKYYYGDGSYLNDTAYGSMRQGDYMKYADVEYNGSKYRAVTFTEYRPLSTSEKIKHVFSDSDFISHQYYNGYFLNNIYWFKYEPIVWYILDKKTGLLLCANVIDSQPYSNTIYRLLTGSVEHEDWIEYTYMYFNDPELTTYANDYATSSIRQWLNNDFYKTAFTDEEKRQIASSPDNYGCFEDKIFLLSEADATNPDYGFYLAENDENYRPNLITFASDYAKSQGLSSGAAFGGISLALQARTTQNTNCRSSEYNKVYNGGWYLRTPGSCYSDCVVGVENCTIGVSFGVDGTCVGIRPAIFLAEESEDPEEELTCCQKIRRFWDSLWDCICNFFCSLFSIISKVFTIFC